MVLTLGLLVRGFFISRKPQHRANPRNLCGIRITYNLKCAQQNLLNVRSKSPAHALRKLVWQLPHNIRVGTTGEKIFNKVLTKKDKINLFRNTNRFIFVFNYKGI